MDRKMLGSFPSTKRLSFEHTSVNISYSRTTSIVIHISNELSSWSSIGKHDKNGKERAIYYISRTLIDYELNYTPIERACLVVIFASQNLRHYMLSHKVQLIARFDPLKYLLSRATLTG